MTRTRGDPRTNCLMPGKKRERFGWILIKSHARSPFCFRSGPATLVFLVVLSDGSSKLAPLLPIIQKLLDGTAGRPDEKRQAAAVEKSTERETVPVIGQCYVLSVYANFLYTRREDGRRRRESP